MIKAAQEHQSHSRLVLVTSEMHMTTRIDDDLKNAPAGILRALNDPKHGASEHFHNVRYPQTKRAHQCLSPEVAS